MGVGFTGYDPPHLLFSSRVQRVQNAGVYGRRPAAPTNKVANIFFPKLRDKNTQQNRTETSTSATTSSRKGVLDYLHNLAYRVESRYSDTSELAADRYVISLISEHNNQRPIDIVTREIRTYNLYLPPP